MQRAIPVDEETFLRIAIQGIYPQYAQAEHRRDYMVINIHDQTRELRRETIQAILDDEKGTLNQNQQNILTAAVDVSGDSMRRIILGENNKSFQ